MSLKLTLKQILILLEQLNGSIKPSEKFNGIQYGEQRDMK
jgi:hypothetical protein